MILLFSQCCAWPDCQSRGPARRPDHPCSESPAAPSGVALPHRRRPCEGRRKLVLHKFCANLGSVAEQPGRGPLTPVALHAHADTWQPRVGRRRRHAFAPTCLSIRAADERETAPRGIAGILPRRIIFPKFPQRANLRLPDSLPERHRP